MFGVHWVKCHPKITGHFFLTLLSLLSFFLPANITAQYNQIKFDHLTIEDGLSHSKVNCIYQDSRGFLWFGTNEGLNRYDGYEFLVFQKGPDNEKGLTANLIRCIIEDKNGNLWIGTEAGAVDIYDRNNGLFRNINSISPYKKTSSNDVNCIIEDKDGIIWLGTGNGLDRVELTDNGINIQNYKIASETENPQANQVSCVLLDNKNTLWVGTFGGGLAIFDPVKQTFTRFLHNPDDKNSISDNDIRTIYQDSKNNMWIGTYSGGLVLYNPENNSFKDFYFEKDIVESRTARVILEDSDGYMWIGTRSGLYYFNTLDNSFVHYAYDPLYAFSLNQNNIMSLFRDKRGDIWIGTWGGINYMNKIKSKFIHISSRVNDHKHLNHSVVYSILEDKKGNLWFGTEEGGVNFMNRKTGLFNYYKFDPGNSNSISGNNIKSLKEDHNGNIWIGTYQGGVSILNPQTGQIHRLRHDEHNPNSLADDDVMAIAIDQQNNSWLGTFGGGLDCYEYKTKKINHIDLGPDPAFRNIYALYLDSSENLWLGANEGYIGRIDKNSRTLKKYKLAIDISGIEVRAINKDSNGNLYFCTIGGGLHFLDVKADTFFVYSQRNGLPSNIVHGALEDAQKNLWISTSNGLSRLDTQTGSIKTFYNDNGLQGNQFCYNSFFQTQNNEMLFGGINGATLFKPEDIQDNQYLPPVIVTNFKIFNKPVLYEDKNGLLKKQISETSEISISYKYSVISFEYAGLNYYISNQNQYAYMMEGFDTGWNYVRKQRIATYTNLDPGEYIFRVKASNNDGYWNNKGTSIKIHISPPFWKTIWAKFLMIFVAGFIVYHLIGDQQRRRNILKANALANINQLKLLRNQMNPHFLFNALGSIRSLILIDKDMAWQMISELSDFLRYSLQTFNKIETDLNSEIQAANSYLNIERIRFRDSLQISFEIEDDARHCMVPAFLIQPLAENAIKHGMKTSPVPLKIVIHISFKDQILSINIANTGKFVESDQKSTPDSEIHGTAIVNIKKRLDIMFNKHYSFEIFEKDDWVQALINIDYHIYNEKNNFNLFKQIGKSANIEV